MSTVSIYISRMPRSRVHICDNIRSEKAKHCSENDVCAKGKPSLTPQPNLHLYCRLYSACLTLVQRGSKRFPNTIGPSLHQALEPQHYRNFHVQYQLEEQQ